MEIFKLLGTIAINNSGANTAIEETTTKTSALAEKLKSGLATAAKVGGAAVTAAAAGVAALTKSSVENYAEYEQLIGGVETLFKQSQNKVMEYANNAYKTAGLSANEYMETVTSFSASLLQSLGGDTNAAAEYADLAITDMADNANKMGTEIGMIQNAYQGFAKQNYTMLDNLKLGYGGTKEEMQRLIDKANALREAQGLNADLTIESYADVVDAIHTVQTEMGITGTTAIEASSTISGSIASMKSAWENLVTGLANPDANVGNLINQMVESAGTAFGNLLPAAETALVGIVQLVNGLAPQIIAAIPGLINQILPMLITAAGNLVSSLTAALPSMLTAILKIVPQLTQTGIDLILAISQGISSALPELTLAAVAAITEFATILSNPVNLTAMLDAALIMLMKLVEGILNAVPQLIDAAVAVVENFVAFITQPGNLEKVINVAIMLITQITEGLIGAIDQLATAAAKIIIALVDYIADPENLSKLVVMGIELVAAIATGLLDAAIELVTSADELIRDLINRFLETDWWSVGAEVINGIWQGLKDVWNNLTDWWGDTVDGLVSKAKDILGIHSPSTVFAEIGRNMVQGLGLGWESSIGEVRDNITASLNFTDTEGSIDGVTTTPTMGSGVSVGENVGGVDKGTGIAVSASKNIVETLAKALVDMATLEDELGTGIVPDPSFETAAIEMIKALMDFLLHDEDEINVNKINNTMADVIEKMAEGLEDDENQKPLNAAAIDTIDTILKPFDDAYSDWVQVGEMIDQGIGEGIKNGWPWLEALVAELAAALFAAAKAALGIASPSKKFAEIGGFMAEGLGVGWKDAFPAVKKSVVDDLNFDMGSVAGVGRSSAKVSGGYSLIQNIYSKAMTPAELLEESHLQAQKAVFLGV